MNDDAKALMNYIKTLLKDGDAPAQLPAAFVGDGDVRELDETLRELRAAAACLRAGDLSRDIDGDGFVLAALQQFQNDFRDFVAHATAVANREVALDHANVFDNLTRQIETALEKKLKDSEARHRLLMDNANDIISTVDLAGNFTYISPAVERITGFTVDEVMNHYREINYFTPEMLKVMERIMAIVNQVMVTGEPLQPIRYEQLQRCKDGRRIWTDTILTGIYDEDGQLRELLGVTRDITEKTRLRDEIQKLSETDKLTQLYNRVRLDRALAAAFKRATETGLAFSLIMLDVDYFKRVNDHFGHQAGDAMLVELAQIFRDSIRCRDIVGRWGGEEFLFILPETDAAGAMVVAQKIRQAVDERRFGRPKRITVSLGVATYHGDAAVDIIVSRADEALYEAKRKGRNSVQLR